MASRGAEGIAHAEDGGQQRGQGERADGPAGLARLHAEGRNTSQNGISQNSQRSPCVEPP